jgi:5'(3')-deoxyribonucleotidase
LTQCRNLKWLIDCDEVLVDLNGVWLEAINKKHNLNIKREDLISWDIGTITGLGDDVFKIFNEIPLYRVAQPIRENVEAVNRLQDAGHIIYLVTAMDPKFAQDRVLWLKEHMPWFDKFKLIISRDKSLLEADVIIDDAAHNIVPNRSRIRVLVDAPYNRGIDETGIIRVKDLRNIEEILK